MRTTITIPKEIVEATISLSGKKRISEAIRSSLNDYIGLRRRLDFLEQKFDKPVSHSLSKIKAKRKRGKWSS